MAATNPSPLFMTFAETGLSAQLLATLEKEGLTTPTPIQEQAIPLILSGANVVGSARTGTGKTFAFALPLIDRLLQNEGRVLVLAPTRELALQLDKNISRVSKGIPKMNPTVLVSGVQLKNQIASLKSGARIIIATPGRLTEHLLAKNLTLDDVIAVVLDEADRMLDSGFAPQVERILDRSKKNRQTLMFSATMSSAITKLVARYAPDATHVTIDDERPDTSLIKQEMCLIGVQRRVALLTRIIHNTPGKILVFTANKRTAQTLYKALSAVEGFTVAGLHGDRTIAGRHEAITGFRKTEFRILVATDIASRGIDIPTIALVVNYDSPLDSQTYLHRIGRTGRAGKPGTAITFVTPQQQPHIARIQEELGITIDVLKKA